MDRKHAPLKWIFVRLFIAGMLVAAALQGLAMPAWASPMNKSVDSESSSEDTITIERIAPERSSGQGYRLAYHVDVPLDAYWKFKIDFDNDFLIKNKYIRDHRLILQNADMAITETKYTFGPDVFFRWQTTIHPKLRSLDFILLNPEQCRQRYQYGTIQLEPEGNGTRVIQKAYFDFLGASFWAYYPWQGGMRDFLTYTAEWEQKTALQLKDRYDGTGQAD